MEGGACALEHGEREELVGTMGADPRVWWDGSSHEWGVKGFL